LGGYFIDETDCSYDPCFIPVSDSCCVDGVCRDNYSPLECADANGLYMRNGSTCADLPCPYCNYIVSKTGLPDGITRFNQINDAITVVQQGTYDQIICVEEGVWDGFNSHGYGDPHELTDGKIFTITSTDPHNQQVVENTIIQRDQTHTSCGCASFYSGGVFYVNGLSFSGTARCGMFDLYMGDLSEEFEKAVEVVFESCRFGPVKNTSWGDMCDAGPPGSGFCSGYVAIESGVDNIWPSLDAHLAQSVNVSLVNCVIDGGLAGGYSSGISLQYPQLPADNNPNAYWYASSFDNPNPNVNISVSESTIINLNTHITYGCAGIQNEPGVGDFVSCYDLYGTNCVFVQNSTICNNNGNNITGPYNDAGGNTIQDQCP